MYVVLLTGGLASGKSTAAAWLREWGASVIDLDVIAAEVQESNDTVRQLLADAFGPDIFDGAGQLIRPRLAERAFSSPENTARLNAISWPPVIERVSDILVGGSCTLAEPAASMTVIQIPLLAEAPEFLDLADEVVAIEAPEELRLQRAIARGLSRADAEQRLASQASDAERRALATTVFDNSGSREQLRDGLRTWYDERTARLF